MSQGPGSAGNVIAAICSFFLPGLGQLVQGRLLLGLGLMLCVPVLYWFWWFFLFPAVIGALLHLFSILAAALYRPH